MRRPSTGRLKDKVTIQKQTTTQGAYGEQKKTWTDIVTRRCQILPIDAKEQYSADAENNVIKYRITFRFETNLVKPKYRLVDKRTSPNRVFDVEGVLDKKNEHGELVCKCAERF